MVIGLYVIFRLLNVKLFGTDTSLHVYNVQSLRHIAPAFDILFVSLTL